MGGQVAAVSRDEQYGFSKTTREAVTLLAGLGVEGDVHAGETIRHQFRMTYEPDLPNLRQVHLMHEELFEELALKGYRVSAGQLGENITTRGVDLLGLPTGALLHLGDRAVLEVTGLRNPCAQLDKIRPGLLKATLDKDAEGNLIRKAGIMGVVVTGGLVRKGDPIVVELPPEPHRPLEPV